MCTRVCAMHARARTHARTHTRTHTFNSPLSRTTWVSQYQKGITNLDFTEARNSEWQWHQLGYMQVCTSLQTDNHASTQPLSFSQARCPSCHHTNSVKALKAKAHISTFRPFSVMQIALKNKKRTEAAITAVIAHASSTDHY